MEKCIVKLENGCWLADVEGDPGRTLVKEKAQCFDDIPSAAKALKEARTFRPFPKACIVHIIDMTL